MSAPTRPSTPRLWTIAFILLIFLGTNIIAFLLFSDFDHGAVIRRVRSCGSELGLTWDSSPTVILLPAVPLCTDVFGFPIIHDVGESPDAGQGSLPGSPHLYRTDGLLEVNPDGPHPIFDLMERAQDRWKKKNQRASRTLKAACDEYERRYSRKPPRGFDIWWTYIQAYGVALPDEYDQISRDMEPFWGIDPQDLQNVQREWENKTDSYTVGKVNQDDAPSMLTFAFENEAQHAHLTYGLPLILETLQEVHTFIPPFRAVFNPHDSAVLPRNFENNKKVLQAAKEGPPLRFDVLEQPEFHGWLSGCPHDAPVWSGDVKFSYDLPPLPDLLLLSNKPNGTATFIHDHPTSMDPCLHPLHLLLHGQYLSHEEGPWSQRTPVPLFSSSPSPLHQDITVALRWTEDLPATDIVPFDQKDDARLEWRGSNTGIWAGAKQQWWLAQRWRLADWAHPHPMRPQPPTVDVLRSTPDARWKVGPPRAQDHRGKARWAPAMADVVFSNEPISCEPEECKQAKRDYEYGRPHDVGAQAKYKYIIDVDGNAWSSRFRRLISSNSVIFKATGYREWFTDRVEPWLHYIPIQLDYSDLLSALYFFRGDSAGHGGHPDLAKKVADAGRAWALTHWRKPDMTAYMFRLFLEYTRVMDSERTNGELDYVYEDRDEVDEALDFVTDQGDDSRIMMTFKELVQRKLERRRQQAAVTPKKGQSEHGEPKDDDGDRLLPD